MHTRMHRVRGYKTTTGRFKFLRIPIYKNNEKKMNVLAMGYVVGPNEIFSAVPIILYKYI